MLIGRPELIRFGRLLLKRWYVPLVGLMVGCAVALLAARQLPPNEYTATTRISISRRFIQSARAYQAHAALVPAQDLAASEALAAEVRGSLGLTSYSVADIRAMLSSSLPTLAAGDALAYVPTDLLIMAKSHQAALSIRLATAAAREVIDMSTEAFDGQQLLTTDGAVSAGLSYSHNGQRNRMVAVFGGAFMALSLVLLFAHMLYGRSAPDADEFRRRGLLLGVVPRYTA